MISAVMTGLPEIDERLTRIATKDANIIARAVVRTGLSKAASNIRRHIPKSIRPRQSDKGIGISVKGRAGKTLGKTGTGVGKSQRNSPQARGGKGKRKGVGVSGRNIHWFAVGTKERFTGQRRTGKRMAVYARMAGQLGKSKGGRHPTGRIVKEKFGQFVRSFGAQGVERAMWIRFETLVMKLANRGTKLSRADEFEGLLE
jgi:hypothetical protein